MLFDEIDGPEQRNVLDGEQRAARHRAHLVGLLEKNLEVGNSLKFGAVLVALLQDDVGHFLVENVRLEFEFLDGLFDLQFVEVVVPVELLEKAAGSVDLACSQE